MVAGVFINLIFILLALIYVICLLVIGILLLVRAFQTNLKNLIYGGIGFIIASVTQSLEQLFDIPFMAEILLTRAGGIMVVLFTNATFHKEKKK